MTLPYDIDTLHERAEELAGIAQHVTDPAKAQELRERADGLVREAATLREAADVREALTEPYDDEVAYR